MARPEIKTIQNLESAFAGESMAHIKYRYFAKLARAAGIQGRIKTSNAKTAGTSRVQAVKLSPCNA